MKSTLNIATAAMMRPLGEMLFGNGREQGMAAGANMVRSLAAADYDQARAQGQQRRNYMQSEQGLGDFFRVAGGDFSGYNTEGLDKAGLQKAKDSITATLQALALPGDTNYQQLAKGRQDMAVHDAAMYGNDPARAAEIAAIFNNGKRFDNAGNGLTFNVATGQMQGSPFNSALINTERAQARNYDASANRYNAMADDIRQGSMMVSPDGTPMLGDMLGGGLGMDAKTYLPGLVKQESGGDHGAVSPKGARGLTQFMPATRQEMIQRHGVDPWRSPQEAIKGAEIYLQQQIDLFKDPKLGLAAYNWGAGNVQQALKRDRAAGGNGTFESVSRFMPKETRDYVPGILRRLNVGGVPMKYAGPQMAKQMYPAGGDRFTQVDAKHPVFQRQMGLDDTGKPLMEFDADTYSRFSRWAQANSFSNQQQAMQAWIAGGMPDAGVPEIPADSLAGQLASALMPGFLGGSTRPPSSQASVPAQHSANGALTAENIKADAAQYHTNPREIIRLIQAKGHRIPDAELAKLRREGFAVN